MWEPFDLIADFRKHGTGDSGYDGASIKAEEHTEGAIISLEECGIAPYSIIVIIYQTLLQTAKFENIDDAAAAYEVMKQEINDLFEWWDDSVSIDEVCDWCTQFVDKHP